MASGAKASALGGFGFLNNLGEVMSPVSPTVGVAKRDRINKIALKGFYDLDFENYPGPALYKKHNALLLNSDARVALAQLPANSVHTCLTSPPYWQVRDYEVDGQIGLEIDVEGYVNALVSVFREVRRVLVPGGTVWLNLGDTFLSGVGTVNGRPPEKGWRRNKQLSLIPFRVAIALQEDGWWIRNAAIWHKTNAMPESVTDRLSVSWEPVFLLTKSENYYFNLDAIREPHTTDDATERSRAVGGKNNGKASGKAELRKHLSSPRHRATIDGLKEIRTRPHAPESVELSAYLKQALKDKGLSIQDVANHLGEPFERTRHYFRTDQLGSRLPPEETWPKLQRYLDLDGRYDSSMEVVVTDNVFRNHPSGKNPGDIFSIPTARSKDGHFATMPEGLAERCLKATLPLGGVCLDPFAGTCTTGKAALKLGGKFIGVDLNKKYLTYYKNHIHDN